LIGIALAGCHQTKCGAGTHENDGVCIGDGPATVTNPTTHTITNPVTHTITNTVPNTITKTVTTTITNTIDTDPVLVPGTFEPPLIQLKKLLGTTGAVGAAGSAQSHMHVSEVRYRDGDGVTRPPEMAYCSYTFGVANVTDPENASYLAQGWTWPASPDPDPPIYDADGVLISGTTFKPRAPGCQHLAFDDDDPDLVYVVQHGDLDDGLGFISAVDLNNTPSYDPISGAYLTSTLAPVLGPQLEETSAAYEGIDYESGHLFVGLHEEGLGMYHRDLLGPDGILGPRDTGTQDSSGNEIFVTDDNTIVPDARYTTNLTNVWDVLVRGTLGYVCDGTNGLVILDMTDPLNPVQLGHVITGGEARDIELNDFGNTAYIATESNGTVIVDVTDPTNPTILSTTTEPSAVVSVAESNGYLAVAAWNDARVYDVADPANPKIVGGSRIAVPKVYTGDDGSRPDITGRTLAVDIHNDVLYVGDWWTPYTYRVVPTRTAPYIYLPETVNLLSFPGDLAVGDSSEVTLEVQNDGNATMTLYNNWTDNPAFTVTPWQVQVPPGGSTTLTLTFTASVAPTLETGDTAVTAPVPVEEHGFLHIASDDPSQPDRVAYLVGNMTGLSVGDPFPDDMAGLMVDGSDWTYAANASGNVLLFAYFATY